LQAVQAAVALAVSFPCVPACGHPLTRAEVLPVTLAAELAVTLADAISVYLGYRDELISPNQSPAE